MEPKLLHKDHRFNVMFILVRL